MSLFCHHRSSTCPLAAKKRKQEDDTGSEPSPKRRNKDSKTTAEDKGRTSSPSLFNENGLKKRSGAGKGLHETPAASPAASSGLGDVDMDDGGMTTSGATSRRRSASPRKLVKSQEKTTKSTKCKGQASTSSSSSSSSPGPTRKSRGGGKAGETHEGKHSKGKKDTKDHNSNKDNLDEDEDSTDLDEDRKMIRETERALRSLSGEWEGQAPFFSYEANKLETMFGDVDKEEQEGEDRKRLSRQNAIVKVDEDQESGKGSGDEGEGEEEEEQEEQEMEHCSTRDEEEEGEEEEEEGEEEGEEVEGDEEEGDEEEDEEGNQEGSEQIAGTESETLEEGAPVPETAEAGTSTEDPDTTPDDQQPNPSTSTQDANASSSSSSCSAGQRQNTSVPDDPFESLLKIEQQCASIQSLVEKQSQERSSTPVTKEEQGHRAGTEAEAVAVDSPPIEAASVPSMESAEPQSESEEDDGEDDEEEEEDAPRSPPVLAPASPSLPVGHNVSPARLEPLHDEPDCREPAMTQQVQVIKIEPQLDLQELDIEHQNQRSLHEQQLHHLPVHASVVVGGGAIVKTEDYVPVAVQEVSSIDLNDVTQNDSDNLTVQTDWEEPAGLVDSCAGDSSMGLTAATTCHSLLATTTDSLTATATFMVESTPSIMNIVPQEHQSLHQNSTFNNANNSQPTDPQMAFPTTTTSQISISNQQQQQQQQHPHQQQQQLQQQQQHHQQQLQHQHLSLVSTSSGQLPSYSMTHTTTIDHSQLGLTSSTPASLSSSTSSFSGSENSLSSLAMVASEALAAEKAAERKHDLCSGMSSANASPQPRLSPLDVAAAKRGRFLDSCMSFSLDFIKEKYYK